MGKTAEDDLPVSPRYIKMLAGLIDRWGRNRVADLAGVNPSTVYRNINEGNLTHTTARKLREAMNELRMEESQGGVDDLPPQVPPALVAVQDADHFSWIEAGTRLLEESPEKFRELLAAALDATRDAKLKSSLSHPLPGRSSGNDSGN